MPIRMVKDEENNSQDNYPDDGGRRQGGGSNPLMGCLPLALMAVFKKPKLLLPLLIIGGLVYFFFFRSGGCAGLAGGDDYTTGGNMDPKKYDKVEVYEPLADNKRNPLPERKTLEQYAPKRLNQGQQGSCVAWSSAYGARTIMEAMRTGKDPNQLAFSPSFLYNSIHLDNCQGAYINDAMDVMKQYGVPPLHVMPYDESTCSQKPNQMQIQNASQFKTRGYQRLSLGGDDQTVNMLAIKQNIAAGAPVVIGMMVGQSFMRDMMGKSVFIPSGEDYNGYGMGGHAMCVVGYDDYKEGGAFRIMNSWGMDWGENGFCWVRYKDFLQFVKEAYGLYPMGEANAPQQASILQVNFALYDVAGDKNISLKKVRDNVFSTKESIAKGTKFKVLITNTVECYTYIFGQETDNTSYVLFPYTAKHSPFCGIAGTRLFPRDYSMVPDDIGNKDYMAIVISKKPLDYDALNKSINLAKGATYADKVNIALNGMTVSQVQFTDANEYVSFNTDDAAQKAVSLVIEVNKK